MAKCTKCFHNCHCNGDLHADEYGTCACDNCECINKQARAEDSTYENNSEIVVDDTGECESCQ